MDGDAKDSVSRLDATTTGTPSWIDGKLGQALNQVPYTVTNDPKLQIIGELTIAFWIYVVNSTNRRTVLNKAYGGEFTINLEIAGDLRMYCGLGGGNANPYVSIYSSVLPVGEWVHACIVKKADGHRKWYLNGVLDVDSGGPNDTAVGSASTSDMTISAGYTSAASVAADLDDLRIYNHALSPREVRDLAQAKVLHYKFDEFAESTENVVQNLDMNTGWQTNYIQNRLFDDIPPPVGVQSTVVSFENDDTSGDGYYHAYGDYAAQADGTTYQVSLWVKTDNPTDVLIRFYTADNAETDRYISEDLTVNASEGWKRLVWAPFTTANPTDSDSLSFRYFGLYDGVTPAYTRLWLCAPQMEAKDHATPFVNGIREDTVTDGSGQDYHAPLTVTNTPQWTDDSKIGSGAYTFDGTNDVVGFSPLTLNVAELSASAWIKVGTHRNDWSYIVHMSPSANIGDSTFALTLNPSNQIVGEVNGNFPLATTVVPIPGDWYHICLTYDGSVQRTYVNGILEKTDTVGAITNNPVGNFLGIGGTPANLTYRPFSGIIEDPRIYATALSADEVMEIYQQRASLDSEGNLFPIQIQQSLKQDHGESEWYCVQSGTATYACVYDNTVIYEQSGSTITAIVTTGIDPQRGTFAITAGNRYFGSKPIHLMREGLQHQIVPISLMGTQFGHLATRNADGTYYIHATDQDATVDIFDNVANGVDGTPTSTVNVSAGSTSTYTTSTLSAWIFFQSENEVVISTEQDGVDQTILVPASKHMYRRMAENERTVKNNPPAVNAANLVSDTDPCVAVEIADASGADCTQGLGVENLSKIHAFGNTLSDYYIVAPYDNTIVQVLYWDGTSWILGEEHTLNGSLDSPDFVRRDGDSGFGVAGTNLSGTALNLGSDANIWKWVSNNPVHITINDSGANEDNLLGWMNDGY